MLKKNIAIIGSGISGLAAAYYLLNKGYKVTVYEKSIFPGGNVQTLQVQVGDNIRWIDMGVSDFNKTTYKILYPIFNQLQVRYKPIENTYLFGDLEGQLAYTTGDQSKYQINNFLLKEITRFQQIATEVFINPRYENFSVEEYFIEKKFSKDFIFHVIYPRINAMFFVDHTNLGQMPIRAVVHYFVLQLGYNKLGTLPIPRRMYFVDGAYTWIQKLLEHLRSTDHFELKLGTSVRISSLENSTVSLIEKGKEVRYDKCVLTTHADEAIRCFTEIPESFREVLKKFQYSSSIVIAHTSATVLPPNTSLWRTYNIHLYDYNKVKDTPYTLTYLVNRHQNDAKNPKYSKLRNNPPFFLTVNPPAPIPKTTVLKTVDGHAAEARFTHNVVNFQSLKAQEDLERLQGLHNIYFAGGYTRGVGLHEECWQSGRYIADEISKNTHIVKGSAKCGFFELNWKH